MAKTKELLQRFIVNGIGVIFLIFLISFANSLKVIFTSAVALIQAVALWEYFQLVKQKKLRPAVSLGIVSSIIYSFVVFFKTQDGLFWDEIPTVILALTLFGCFVFYAFVGDQPIANISATFFGILYVTIPLSLIIQIVYFFKNDSSCLGCFWLIYLIAVTKSADTGAFFVGRRYGKMKLAPKLSPNKTVEGAIGGIVCSILISVIFCFIGKSLAIFSFFGFDTALISGLVIGIGGQMGDLAESLLKRDAQIKDSNKIPGVGGILDMVDSLLFTTPIIYIFLKLQVM